MPTRRASNDQARFRLVVERPDRPLYLGPWQLRVMARQRAVSLRIDDVCGDFGERRVEMLVRFHNQDLPFGGIDAEVREQVGAHALGAGGDQLGLDTAYA